MHSHQELLKHARNNLHQVELGIHSREERKRRFQEEIGRLSEQRKRLDSEQEQKRAAID